MVSVATHTRPPVGQPAYSQLVTQAASARGWFFAKIAEPATKTPITRVSATIFVMSPPRRELPGRTTAFEISQNHRSSHGTLLNRKGLNTAEE